jgi:hypothetical protein
MDILYIGADLDEQESSVQHDEDNCAELDTIRCTEREKCINLCNSYNTYLMMDVPVINASDKDKIADRIIPIAELYKSFQDISSYKMHIDLMWYLKENSTEGGDNVLKDLNDPNIVHEDKGFVLTKKMLKCLPVHLFFQPPRQNRGCNFEYDFKDPETKKRTNTRMTSSVKVSLEEKYNMAMQFVPPHSSS